VRVVVYDRTCSVLSKAWRAGIVVHRPDAFFGATSWTDALEWLATHERIDELQYWGHGKWGKVLVDKDGLDESAFAAAHRLRPKLEAVRERLTPDALVWMRTCEIFGARAGHEFAMRLADFFGTRVAGHTFVIGAVQSGLHGLLPGHRPDWPEAEGISEGTPEDPKRAHGSSIVATHTVSCFARAVPVSWFA
jgi:hypothetical protein